MHFENLTDENFLLYAIKAYDKPNCIMSEFHEDMKRFNYLKRLFRRYRKHGDHRERLILNHIVLPTSSSGKYDYVGNYFEPGMSKILKIK